MSNSTMSYIDLQEQMMWQSQQLQQWILPFTDSHSNKRSASAALFPQGHLDHNLPHHHTFDYNMFNTQTQPPANLQRAHTSPDTTQWYCDYDVQFLDESSFNSTYYTDIEASPFDDVASCFSETSSSYFSSDYTESPTGSVSPATRNHSVVSVSNSKAQQNRTEVDALMKTLQPMSVTSTHTTLRASSKPKRHVCPYTDCLKAFSQPTHLKIHLRSHTGEKPYICSVSSCGQSFSQLGNLRTHERRHVGQRPNRRRSAPEPCSDSKKYICKLDNCRSNADVDAGGKVFTQLGNLKAHMNKFHKETLARLSEQLSSRTSYQSCDKTGMNWEEVEELRSYFQELYKNSNKGIKGRGKGRKVEILL